MIPYRLGDKVKILRSCKEGLITGLEVIEGDLFYEVDLCGFFEHAELHLIAECSERSYQQVLDMHMDEQTKEELEDWEG